MLRFKILASTIPLMLAAFFARGEWGADVRPCVSTGDGSVQIASSLWQAQLHVSFTEDPAAATVRVQVVDSAEAADFAMVDDIDDASAGGCSVSAATRFIAITDAASAGEPVIYLSGSAEADYRIFVKSRSFTPRDAAALIVGARGGRNRMAAAEL